jgi:alpha-glucosidase
MAEGVTRRRGVLALAGLLAAVAAAPAEAAVKIGSDRVVVTTPAGARAIVERSPLRISFLDASGRKVLRQVAPSGSAVAVVPPTPHVQFGMNGPPPPTLYAPLGFLVGTHQVDQFPASQWQGVLQSVTESGTLYSARRVTRAQAQGGGARLELATSDPSGRRLILTIAPLGPGSALRLSVRPTPASGVATMADSFASPANEAFRGFGGRHNDLDQRGQDFYNWLQQENVGSGTASTMPEEDRYLFPNGPTAAYYVQSSFVSSSGYGFLLDRDEISHWRIASDRSDAWQVEVAAPALDYVVAAGPASRAIRELTALTGRQPVPPTWAVGSIFDRLVKYPSDPPDQHLQEVQSDLREIARRHLRVDGYRIEGWQFLPRQTLSRLIRQLRRRGIHPMLYFRLFVGKDEIGTDDPAAFDQAVEKGYVATHADGSPYVFSSNFNKDGAVIDFTDPAAVRWWKGRIRAALELGADGFMQDFGEQVVADMHFDDGSTGVRMHNRLPTLAHRATRQVIESFERRHPGRRIWFFTRAGHTGRPGAAAYEGGNFPGDETTDWTRSSGLASLTTDMLNRAIGGAYGFTTDIGGYFDIGPYEPTSRELFIRWAEWAALSPFFRLHGSVGAGTHTPWSYGKDTLSTYKRLIRLHLRARPLILRLWRTARRSGIPPTRPLWLASPGDPRAADQDQEWLLGRDVLVAPVVVEGARARDVYLPPGCWRRAGTQRRYRGPRSARVGAGLGQLPWFKRCGTSSLADAARADR